MKLKMNQQKDVCTLNIAGSVDAKSYTVLRAGLTQLLKTGKNRIIIDMAEVDAIDPTAIKDICQLDSLARELAGQIVLSGLSPILRRHVSTLNPPPTIQILAHADEALKIVLSGQKPAGEAALPADIATELKSLRLRVREVDELRRRVLEVENQTDSSKMREENALLKGQIEKLEGHVMNLLLANRDAGSVIDWKDRYKLLEDQIADLVGPAAGGSAPAGK
jgi:anti-anti-sigma factor